MVGDSTGAQPGPASTPDAPTPATPRSVHPDALRTTRSDRPWTAADMPRQHGRTIVVTGATSGLGAAAAAALAGAGARVVLACRDVTRGRAVAARLPGAEVRELDLADLASVRAFATSGWPDPVDVLINNAGVFPTGPGTTRDGFATAMGVNHLGHFALTGLLLDRIGDRVVTLSSLGHRSGRLNLDDVAGAASRRSALRAYSDSKLANLAFAFALERRLAAAGSPLRSVAAHPGMTATDLVGRTRSVRDRVLRMVNRVVTQPVTDGVAPTLFAATVHDVPGGAYVGPAGRGEIAGPPRYVTASAAARDPAVQDALWAASERLTGVRFPTPHPQAHLVR